MTVQPIRLKPVRPVFLSPAEAKHKQVQLLVIDVQNPKFATHMMPEAQRLNIDVSLKDISKDQPILLTCLTKQRSLIAAQQFINRGYRKVYILQGGLIAWQRAGYTVWRTKSPA